MSTAAGLTDARVEAALAKAVELGERGVQVAAYVGEELVVDAWTGPADEEAGRPVDGETLFTLFSVSKAVSSVAIHLQAERGLVDLEAPVARYWPEYARHGKEAITVRHVLTHRAGVPQMPPDVTPERMCDWEWMTAALTEIEPAYPAGTQSGYLSYTHGWLLGEVVRRTDPQGRPFGRFVQDEICAPLGVDALWLGIPPQEEHRVATLTFPVRPDRPGTLRPLAVPDPVLFVPEVYNRSDVRQACIPAAGGIGNARAVARLFALLANGGELGGVRLLAPETVESFFVPRPGYDEYDEWTGAYAKVGIASFYLESPMVAPPPEARIICSPGAGETIGLADVRSGLAFAICHNRMVYYAPEPPFHDLGRALWEIAAEVGH